jgi:hypothetical protein
MKTTSLFFALGAALCGCASKSQTTIGDTTAGAYSVHIFREGPACTAGVMTTLVLKTTAGGMPSSVVGWVGNEDAEASAVTAVYDPNDGDFDLDVTCPNPLPTDAKFYFTLDGTATGSIALK